VLHLLKALPIQKLHDDEAFFFDIPDFIDGADVEMI
jgi:hypothetical protein